MADEEKKYTLEDKMRDAARAFSRARLYHRELQEIYHFFTPYRVSTVERAQESGRHSEGVSRSHGVFDGTGPAAAAAFVANMKADWMPAFDDFFKLQAGPLFPGDDDAKAQYNGKLQSIGRVVHALTSKIRATATEECFSDLFAGTGAMVLTKGDQRQAIRGFSVPVMELAMENGPWGDIERWFWKRKYKTRDIEPMWPKAVIPPGLAQAIKVDRNSDVEVTQYTYWDYQSQRFCTTVWTNLDPDKELWNEDSKTCPWVTPRMYVVPGESYGRGLAHLGLPFVKTVNKARELALRAAAFALLGLWTRRHDGVFNPDTARMVPGAMWKVASNGSGGMGKSIDRLDVPHNFDVSSVIIKDEREQIRRVLLDDELPELADRVRSPTEIAARRRRYERNRGGATTRLAFELVTPFVQRSVDILGELRLLPSDIHLDDVLTQCLVTAPAAAAQHSDRVDRMVSWLQMMTGLFGPQVAALNAEVEKILPEIGRDLGVDEKFIRKKTELEQLKMLIDGAVQAALKQQGAQPTAPAPPGQADQPAQPEAQNNAGYQNGGF